MEEPEFSWRPLGRLFVEKGLLTELRLEHALEDQAATGGRLGEKLVALGYVTSTALTRLLAEQYGVELALDTGFGTGLRAVLERRLDASEPDPPPVLTLVEPPDDPLPTFAGLEEQWAKLAAADARIVELEQEVARLTAQVAELSPPAKKRRSSGIKPAP